MPKNSFLQHVFNKSGFELENNGLIIIFGKL